MFWLSLRLKFFFPVKIYCPARFSIRPSGRFICDGRIVIGNPDKNKAVVSAVPANFWFGENTLVRMGAGVNFGPGVNIIVKENGILQIGDNSYFTSDMHLEVVNKITVGKNCAISWGVTMIDDDHHEVIRNGNSGNQKNEISIGDHVWVGCNVVILKNTIIGNNCIVAAGSVVKGIFPDNTLIAGNPAKIVKENIDWK